MKKLVVVRNASEDNISLALKKLNDNKNLKVNGLYASELITLQNNNPELYNAVAEMISSDRWCPYAGAFAPDCDYSSSALIKSCLYSAQYFKTVFNKEFKVFHGTKIYNNSFVQTVYSSLFDSAAIENECFTHWLKCPEDGFITLILAADECDIADELSDSDEYLTYEEYSESVFASKRELPIDTAHFAFDEADSTEKELLNAEKISVINGIDNTAELKKAWISYFTGDCDTANKIAERIGSSSADISSLLTLSGDDIELHEIKFTEDGSGDVLIRTRETAGKEKASYILCDRLNAGFRFEIMPYEIQTFRIKSDSTGFVTEIYICE